MIETNFFGLWCLKLLFYIHSISFSKTERKMRAKKHWEVRKCWERIFEFVVYDERENVCWKCIGVYQQKIYFYVEKIVTFFSFVSFLVRSQTEQQILRIIKKTIFLCYITRFCFSSENSTNFYVIFIERCLLWGFSLTN